MRKLAPIVIVLACASTALAGIFWHPTKEQFARGGDPTEWAAQGYVPSAQADYSPWFDDGLDGEGEFRHARTAKPLWHAKDNGADAPVSKSAQELADEAALSLKDSRYGTLIRKVGERLALVDAEARLRSAGKTESADRALARVGVLNGELAALTADLP